MLWKGLPLSTPVGYFSQFGEDLVWERLFGRKKDGLCIEVGGSDGQTGSNSLHFEREGWKTIVVEPLPELARGIRARRPKAVVIEAAAFDESGIRPFRVSEGVLGTSTLVPDSTLAPDQGSESSKFIEVRVERLDLLVEPFIDRPVDFVSIDVEGAELQVLKGFSLSRWRPAVLIIEDNSFLQDRSVEDLLLGDGYRPFLRTGVNDWFISADRAEEVSDFLERHRQWRSRARPAMATRRGRFLLAVSDKAFAVSAGEHELRFAAERSAELVFPRPGFAARLLLALIRYLPRPFWKIVRAMEILVAPRKRTD